MRPWKDVSSYLNLSRHLEQMLVKRIRTWSHAIGLETSLFAPVAASGLLLAQQEKIAPWTLLPDPLRRNLDIFFSLSPPLRLSTSTSKGEPSKADAQVPALASAALVLTNNTPLLLLVVFSLCWGGFYLGQTAEFWTFLHSRALLSSVLKSPT